MSQGSLSRSVSDRCDHSRPIKVQDLPTHCTLLLQSRGFSFEFEQLRTVGRRQSCLAAKEGGNKAKNRIPSLLPYDHSRVKLEVADGTCDYVNANFVGGLTSPQEFIVTQVPYLYNHIIL